MRSAEFDILVIGAGIAGTSVAAHLSEARSVAVLERESQPGYHSTGRSAALFSAVYGAAPVRALSRASRNFLFEPGLDFAEAALVKPRAWMHIATPAQREHLEAFASLPDIAPVTRRLTGEQARHLCPILRTDQVGTAVVELAAADVDVHGLQQGYLRLLRSRGGSLLVDHEITGIRREGRRWAVDTAGTTFYAPIIVNAAGAWADVVATMAGVAQLGLQPMRRTALLVDAPAGETIENWPIVFDIGERFYFKPDAGLLLLSPADETPVDPCDAQPDEWDVAVAVDRIETATTLRVQHVRRKWAGLRNFVADRIPVVGYEPDVTGYFWLAGQGGYGIQTAPALARLATALILGRPIPADITAAGVEAGDLSPTRLQLRHRIPCPHAMAEEAR